MMLLTYSRNIGTPIEELISRSQLICVWNDVEQNYLVDSQGPICGQISIYWA